MSSARRNWTRIDRQKRVFERFYQKEFEKALNDQLQQVYSLIPLMTNPKQLENLSNKINMEPIKKVFRDLYTRVPVQFMVVTMDQLKSAGELVQKEFDPPMEDGLFTSPDSFVYLWETQLDSWILNNVGDRIVTITGTSQKEWMRIVQNITSEALERGLSIPDTINLLNTEIPKEWRKTLYRAETIARTEILSASNEGSYFAAKSTGLDLVKVWTARLDGRERLAHREANGQMVDMDKPYIVDVEELSKPGDPKGSAENVINCRCVMQFVRRQVPIAAGGEGQGLLV